MSRINSVPSMPERLRQWPLLRMQWRHLLFMHWPAPAEALRPLIPAGLEIDEFDGFAWVGLIPFTMRNVLPVLAPAAPGLSDLPYLSAFHECNVRTYVSYRGEPGVWFFSLDAASRAAVWAARRFFQLPYFLSRMELSRRGDEVRYSVQRLNDLPCQRSGRSLIPAPDGTRHGPAMRCIWRAGRRLPQSQPGELAHFLTERYQLYSADRNGNLYRCRIRHKPWLLREARLLSLEDALVQAAGVTIGHSQPPLLHHADELDVRVWPLERA